MLSSIAIISNIPDIRNLVGSYRAVDTVVETDILSIGRHWKYIQDGQNVILTGFFGGPIDEGLYAIYLSSEHASHDLWELGFPVSTFADKCQNKIQNLRGKVVRLRAVISKNLHRLINVTSIALVVQTNEGVVYRKLC